jgi:hypothetical protein
VIKKAKENIFYTLLKSIVPVFFASALFSQSYNAEVLNYESTYTADNTILNESNFVAIQVNNPQGDKYGIVRIHYSQENPVSDLQAWIEDVNGKKIRKLKNDEIYDGNSIDKGMLYADTYIKTFELKYNVYPYIIKYKYNCKEKEFPLICDWSLLYTEIPTYEAKLIITTPIGYRISCYQNKIGPPLKDSTKKNITLTWQTQYKQPVKPEVSSPSLLEFLPRILVVPVEFTYGIKGSQQTWASLGNWNYMLNRGLDDLPESEVQKVHELINGISNKKLIVKKLYQYLQDNTRYEGVDIGIGGVKSYPASYVVSKRYGDCKALSNYMKALLKTAGIPSHTALIYGGKDGDTRKILSSFVSPEFNHAILLVPLANDSIWLDCTSKINPPGYLGSFTQNRYALVIDSANSRLVKTPALVPSNCYTSSNNKVSIDTAGNALLKSSTICKGIGFDMDASYSEKLNKEKQKEYLGTIVPYQNFELKQLNIKKDCRDSADIKMDYSLNLKSNITQTGNFMFLQLSAHTLPAFENPSKRHLPVCLPYPINYFDTTEVSIPDQYKVQKKPDENYETKYGTIKIKYVQVDTKIEIYRNILLNAGDYSTQEYGDFYRFITKLHEAINTPLSFIKNE